MCHRSRGRRPAGDTSAGNCDWSMSMRTATTPASRDMCSVTPGCVPSATLWMAFDNRLLSPSRSVVAKCTLVPPVVVCDDAGYCFCTGAA